VVGGKWLKKIIALGLILLSLFPITISISLFNVKAEVNFSCKVLLWGNQQATPPAIIESGPNIVKIYVNAARWTSKASTLKFSYKVLHVSVFKQNELQKIIDSVGASELFTITQVSVEEFNRGNPSDLSAYDAIVFGINDWGEVAGNRSRKYGRLAELQNYVSNGGGIVWTHDTLEQWWDYGSQIEEPAGVDNYDISDKNRERVWYSSIKIVEDHPILHNPYEIGNVGDIISVQYTHTNGGRVKTAKAIIKSYNGKYDPQATDANDFYLTVNEYGKGRVAIIEIGHSTIREDKPSVINIPFEKESKVLINTLCWVSSAEVVPPEMIILNFSVTFENGRYDVLLHVPLSSFKTSIENFPSIYYSWFSSIDANILKSAFYVYRHVEQPDQYPILDITIQKGDQEIAEKYIKTKILNGLLQYCYELFFLTSPLMLDSYKSNGENWLKAHEDLKWTVFISDLLCGGTYYATVILPLIKTINNLFGEDISKQVESSIRLIYELLTEGNDGLIKKYGYEQVRRITNILTSSGLISIADYNTMELYQNIIKDPDKSSSVICQIQKDVFNVEIKPNAQSIITNFIKKLPASTIGNFACGTALSFMAYFGSGLTAQTAMQIGTSAMFKGFFGYTLPLAFASAIHQAYITPMAQSLHEAWEAMKHESDVYFDLHKYGQKMANPINNIFNLTNVQIFSALQGIRCVIEYYYYMNCYFYTEGQYLNPKRAQEAATMKEMADSAISQAKDWASMLEKIHGYAKAIIDKVDPEGSTFNFTFQPPIIVFPVIPPNSGGFVLIANQTVNITMNCGSYYFIVQNREWFTNFTHSIYVDDPFGRIYLIIFNPPEGKYDVEAQDYTPLTLIKFVPTTDGVILSRIEEGTTTMSFEVSPNGEIKIVAPPWWAQHQLWIVTGVIGTIVILIISVALIKRRKSICQLTTKMGSNNSGIFEI